MIFVTKTDGGERFARGEPEVGAMGGQIPKTSGDALDVYTWHKILEGYNSTVNYVSCDGDYDGTMEFQNIGGAGDNWDRINQ